MYNLDYYTCGNNIFVSSATKDYSGYRLMLSSNNTKINEKVLQATHHKAWFKVDDVKEIISVTEIKIGKPYNHRYELDTSIIVPIGVSLPDTLTLDDVGEYKDDDYNYSWSKFAPYYMFKDCYKRVYDVSEDAWISEEFTANFLGDITVKDGENVEDAKYSIYKSQYPSEGFKTVDIKDVATFSELEQIMTSEFLIKNRPCSLTKDISYKIVRAYIIQNLDYSECAITSDYDFCFTVKKKIHIKPFTKRTPILKKNGKAYRQPKFNTKTITDMLVEVFNIAPKAYQTYNVIDEFRGDTLNDLIENVRLYLDHLMSVLNAPVVECEHCNGLGCFVTEYNKE